MATILVVDDYPANRKYLTTLLGHGKHRLLEAANGQEALALVRAERPDLVITDILMPTMDGYEFVQRLRAEPSLARTVVIFYTATYGPREAQTLAEAAGVAYVIVKPAEPELILKTVEAALDTAAASSPAPVVKTGPLVRPSEVLSNKLAQKVSELNLVSSRLDALVALGLDLMVERDPLQMLRRGCQAARDIVGAQYAAIGTLGLAPDGQSLEHFITSGMEDAVVAGIGAPPTGRGLLGALLTERRTLRLRDLQTDPRALGFPPGHPSMRSFLGTPIASPTQVYGRLYLTDKLGAEEFSEEDERLALTLSAQIAVAYENILQYAEIQRHAARLQLEITERQRAEHALSIAFQASPAGMAILRADTGLILDINESFSAITGLPHAAAVGHTSSEFDFITPAERQRMMEIFRQQGGHLRNFEMTIRHTSGETRTVLYSAEPIHLEQGACLLAIVYDITERKQAEEALRQAEAKYRLLVEQVPVITYAAALNETSSNLYISPQIEGLGYTPAEWLADPARWVNSIYPADHARVMAELQNSQATGQPFRSEYRLTTRAGQLRWFQDEARIVRDAEGRPLHLQGVLLDITERKQAEAALRQSEELYRLMFDDNPMPMWVYDTQTLGFLAVNEAALSHYGYERSEFQRMTIRDIRPPETLPRLEANLSAPARPKEQGLWIHRKKDGTPIDVEINSHQIVLAGRPARLVLANDVTQRRRAEAALRDSEQRLRILFEHSPNAILLIDPHSSPVTWAIVDCNEMAGRMNGYRRDELIGQSVEILNTESSPPEAHAAYLERLRRAEILQYETVHRRRDGSLFSIEVSTSIVMLAGRELVLGIDRDITERKQAEEALARERHLMRALMDNLPDAIYFKDIQSRFIRVNHATANKHGFSDPDQLVGKSDFDFFTAEKAQVYSDHERHIIQSGQPQIDLEEEEVWADGTTTWASTTQLPLRDEAGQVIGLIGVSRDITERKQAEAKLRLSDEILQRVASLILVGDAQGQITYASPYFKTALGYAPEELLGEGWWRLSRPDPSQSQAEQEAVQASAQGAAPVFEKPYERLVTARDGSQHWIVWQDALVPGYGVVGVGHDVSEHKRSEAALLAKDEEIRAMTQQLWHTAKLATMGELAAGIAHELNNPLATISLRTEVLLADLPADDPQALNARRSLNIIAQEVERMGNLVTNLLQSSRRTETQRTTTDVREEIEQTLELIHSHLRKRQIEVVKEFAADVPLVLADRQQFRQVFLNLFTNASDAMSPGGRLTLRVAVQTTENHFAPDEPQVLVEVSDTGTGIPAELLSKVWEPFYTTKPAGQGTGLGLPICRRILEEHGGTINIESAGITGRGTRVRLTLPAQPR